MIIYIEHFSSVKTHVFSPNKMSNISINIPRRELNPSELNNVSNNILTIDVDRKKNQVLIIIGAAIKIPLSLKAKIINNRNSDNKKENRKHDIVNDISNKYKISSVIVWSSMSKDGNCQLS